MSEAPIAGYHAPADLTELLGLLARGGRRLALLAGGTDLVVRMRRASGLPPGCDALVNLKRVAALHALWVGPEDLVLGALTTVSTLRRHPHIREVSPLLARSADRFAGEQIRNAATVGGNLCNASPAGDLQIPLLLHEARATLASVRGRRTLAIDQLLLGPGQTALAPDEVLVDVVVPRLGSYRMSLLKFGLRPAMEIAIVSVGVALRLEGRRIADARVALGAVAPTARRCLPAEEVLIGRPVGPDAFAAAGDAASANAAPISDVRASADYRRTLVRTLTRRALADACAR